MGRIRLVANLYDHTGIDIRGAYEQGDFKFHIQNSGQAQKFIRRLFKLRLLPKSCS